MNTVGEVIRRVRLHLSENPEGTLSQDSAASVDLIGPLRVEVVGPGGYRITSDMPAALGGSASAPSPGWFVRAGLAACTATIIAMRAAEQDITLTELVVDVTSRSDDRGILGIDGVDAGPASISVTVRVGGDASERELREIVAWAEAHSPVGDALRRAIPIETDFEVVGASQHSLT